MVYAGFWWRCLAYIIDSLLILIVMFVFGFLLGPFVWHLSEEMLDVYFQVWGVVISLAYTLAFWLSKAATPGKMAVKARIVDATTGGKPTGGQFVGRYFAYFLSALPLGLGFIWAAFDRRKQGWHDKLAGTVVIRLPSRGTAPVHFEKTAAP